MTRAPDPEFERWKSRAAAADIMTAARNCGAKLKRSGVEFMGPCPVCGGKDRFGINPKKRIFICRGAAGGDVIALVQHCRRVDFLGACEILTGEAPPRGQSKPLPDDRRAEIEEQQRRNEEEQARREREEARDRGLSAAESARIWEREVVPVDGTPAELYLVENRGIPKPPAGWPRECIGFHRGLDYRKPPFPRLPALIGRIQDVAGDTVAIHAIFLTPAGKKADLDPPKLTYGPMMGGAIRIGGVGPVVNVCEGLETGLGICWLLGWREPVWPTLGTSGLAGIEPPLECEHLRAWLDGDLPIKRVGDEYVPDKMGPGQRAGAELRRRAGEVGLKFSANEPPPDSDWLDVWRSVAGLSGAA